MADPFHELVQELGKRAVRFVIVGVAGANYFATNAGTLFTTEDRDLFLPPDPGNLLQAWQACEAVGLALWCGDEPLDIPRDRFLADAIVARRALVRATGESDLLVDLTLVMAGFDFETVWTERRIFVVDSVDVPVARLSHIVRSGMETGAVYMPAPQSGSPMTYMLNGKQHIVVAISGGSYSGELAAFRLPS